MSPPRWSGSKTKSEIKRERRESFRTNVFSPPPMAVPPGVAQIMVCVSAAGQIQQSAGGVIVRNRIGRRLCFAIRSFVRAAVSCYGGTNFGFRRACNSAGCVRSVQKVYFGRRSRCSRAEAGRASSASLRRAGLRLARLKPALLFLSLHTEQTEQPFPLPDRTARIRLVSKIRPRRPRRTIMLSAVHPSLLRSREQFKMHDFTIKRG